MSSKTGTIYIHSDQNEEDEASDILLPKKTEKLDELAKRAGMIIYEVSYLRSFLFPYRDTLTICPNRITITRKSLFSTEEYPMAIESVTNAKVYHHLFWGSLEIETFGIPKPESLDHLKIKDARLARRYILALVECKKNNIDLSGLDIERLREKLKEIGMVRFETGEKDYHNI